MSLKAQLEAVIYAADEPVTLAQLALLFTEDALEFKAEQEAAAAARGAEAVNASADAGQAQADLGGELAFLGLEQGDAAVTEGETAPNEGPAPESAVESSAEVSTKPEEPATAAPADGAGQDFVSEVAEAAAGEAADGTPDETELKRQAKQRDRVVRSVLRQLLDELIAEYANDDRGVEIREIAGGFRMATKPECHDVVRAFVKSQKPPLKLSLPALETLAVIAYKQPVTAPEVNEIRGVDSSGVFGSLLARKLIATAGRKQVIGRPILYKTTKEFLMRFGLKDVSELPSMEEFEKMAAIELEESELAPEGESAEEIREELNEELKLERATESAEDAGESTESDKIESNGESTHADGEPNREGEPVRSE